MWYNKILLKKLQIIILEDLLIILLYSSKELSKIKKVTLSYAYDYNNPYET